MPEVEASEEDNEEAPVNEDEVAESKEETPAAQDGETNDEPIPQPEDGATEVTKHSYGQCSLTRYDIDNTLMEKYPGCGGREKWIKTQLKELIPYSTYTEKYEALETETEKSDFMDETLIQELRNHRDHVLAKKNGKYTEYKYNLEDETKDRLEAYKFINNHVKTSKRDFKDCIKLVMGYTAVRVTWKQKENQEAKKEYLKTLS